MRKLLLLPVTVVAVLLGLSTPASAGGWAVSTLDALPNPTPGEEVEVGFTVRQHGVTPADIDDAGITTRTSAGKSTFWPARQEGPTGHYVAAVTFPEAGSYTWEVNQGYFAAQPLGTIEVPGGAKVPTPAPPVARPAPAPVTIHEPVRMPLAVRVLLPTVAVAAAGVAIAEAVHARRARRQQLAAA